MITLRPFRDADEAAILSWCQDEATFYKWTFGVLGEPPITEEKFRTMMNYRRFTAVDMDNEPVGYFIMRRPEGRLREIRFGFGIVATDRRGHGIGKAMLKQGLDLAFETYGATRVTLGVLEDNEMGRACYKAVGFRETGTIEQYSLCGKELKALEMEALPE